MSHESLTSLRNKLKYSDTWQGRIAKCTLDDESPFVDYLGLSLDADLGTDHFKYLGPIEKKIKLSIEVG